ncbi:MAG: hypothetical protein LBD50_03370 [Rickettsiales bacterium]|jgi:hypothetical protein|nr:hypothetical protein [Rickettsiales bacterium]
MLRKLLAGLFVILFSLNVAGAASSIRKLGGATTTTAASAARSASATTLKAGAQTRTGARSASTKATTTKSSSTVSTGANSSRLSSSAFLAERGKLGVSVSGSGSGGGNVDLSDYARVDYVDNLFGALESRTDVVEGNLDAKADAADTYTKQEVDDALGGVVSGVSCGVSGDGTYMINVSGGAEDCIAVSTTGNVFIE